MKAKDTSLLTFMRNATQSILKLYDTLLPKLMNGEVRVEVQ